MEKNNFVGTCVNSFDNDGDCTLSQLPYNTISDFANVEGVEVEKSQFLEANEIHEDLLRFFRDKVLCYLKDEENNIYFIYDEYDDIHYFFTQCD